MFFNTSKQKRTLADSFENKRFNSPNDLVVSSQGDIYFTDPPYGLVGLNDSPHKELDFNGVFRLAPDGQVSLVEASMTFPNGIALSPDERTLYVSNSDPDRAIWMAFDIRRDGSVANPRIFYDATHLVQAGLSGLPDGLAVDQRGNLFATGPGGVLVFTATAEYLGRIDPGKPTANCTFGGSGQTLYMTAKDVLCRIELTTRGLGF